MGLRAAEPGYIIVGRIDPGNRGRRRACHWHADEQFHGPFRTQGLDRSNSADGPHDRGGADRRKNRPAARQARLYRHRFRGRVHGRSCETAGLPDALSDSRFRLRGFDFAAILPPAGNRVPRWRPVDGGSRRPAHHHGYDKDRRQGDRGYRMTNPAFSGEAWLAREKKSRPARPEGGPATWTRTSRTPACP